jgi:hypothetical protein
VTTTETLVTVAVTVTEFWPAGTVAVTAKVFDW